MRSPLTGCKFPPLYCVCRDVKAVPLLSSSRWLVRRADCTRHTASGAGDRPRTFGRRQTRQAVTLFLFTDLLVLAKRKGEDRYIVQVGSLVCAVGQLLYFTV